MIGEYHNHWEVLEFSHKKNGSSYYLCRCRCGKKATVRDSNLRKGVSTQCKSCSGKQNGRKGLDSKAKGNLYIVRCKEFIKVGCTSDKTMDRRIISLQTGNPFDMTVELFMENMGHAEPWLHTMLSKHHHRGEWFLYPEPIGVDLLGSIISTINKESE